MADELKSGEDILSSDNPAAATQSDNPNGPAEETLSVAETQDGGAAEENASAAETKPKTRVLKIVSIAAECLLGAIVAFLLVVGGILVYDKYVNKSLAPSVFGYSQFIIATGSMEPEISAGDMIIVKKTGDYEVGDVITFFMDGSVISTTHRIIEIRVENGKTIYITKGDANNAPDPGVPAENVVGEVVATLSGVGLFFEWVKTTQGIVCVVLLAGIIVALILIKVL